MVYTEKFHSEVFFVKSSLLGVCNGQMGRMRGAREMYFLEFQSVCTLLYTFQERMGVLSCNFTNTGCHQTFSFQSFQWRCSVISLCFQLVLMTNEVETFFPVPLSYYCLFEQLLFKPSAIIYN